MVSDRGGSTNCTGKEPQANPLVGLAHLDHLSPHNRASAATLLGWSRTLEEHLLSYDEWLGQNRFQDVVSATGTDERRVGIPADSSSKTARLAG